MTIPKHLQGITRDEIDWKSKSNDYWREVLPMKTYAVTREKGTERPFTGEYTRFSEAGVYLCSNCGQELFSSDSKFEAGCGWPSFSDVAGQGLIDEKEDNSMMMERTEVLCSGCKAHLGHVFDDGPEPLGLRYCINSLALFHKKLP